MMIDGHKDRTVEERKLIWDEENRLLAVDENGFVSNYWYDANGERTVKTSGENEAIYVNSEFSGGNTGTARFSLYVSPYLVAGQGGKYTKHIYIGSQRIVSKLGDLASYGADPRRIPYAGNEADGLTINYKDKYAQQLQSIKDNYKTFDIPYTGKDNNDYVNGQGFCCDDGTPEAAQARAMARASIDANFKPNEEYEKMQFYYHPDHLGSSSYITNLDGEVSQHIEYVPFGEVFIEERNNTWNTPYLFNAKELDEETGMYYYGARYYDPRLSLWMSTDPLQEKYLNISTYCYTANNPINITDTDGRKLKGVQESDAAKIHEDVNLVFAAERFNGFRNLITRSGRNEGVETFDKIDMNALDSYLAGATDLSEDDKALIRIVTNTINSESVHEIQYLSKEDPLPNKSMAASELISIYDKNKWGDIPAGIIGNSTIETENGSYSMIVEDVGFPLDYVNALKENVPNPLGRASMSFHEVFGHGRPSALGRTHEQQHTDAIRLENLTLRVSGYSSIQRTGLDHFSETEVSDYSNLPDYK